METLGETPYLLYSFIHTKYKPNEVESTNKRDLEIVSKFYNEEGVKEEG